MASRKPCKIEEIIHTVTADSNSEFITLEEDLSHKDEKSKTFRRPGKKLATLPWLNTRIA